MILTYADGRVIAKPQRSDYETLLEYIEAVHAYNSEVTLVANRAFNDAFRKAIKR